MFTVQFKPGPHTVTGDSTLDCRGIQSSLLGSAGKDGNVKGCELPVSVLDGTIVGDGLPIGEATGRALKSLAQEGLDLTVATGCNGWKAHPIVDLGAQNLERSGCAPPRSRFLLSLDPGVILCVHIEGNPLCCLGAWAGSP